MKFPYREVQLAFGSSKPCILDVHSTDFYQVSYDDKSDSVPYSLKKLQRVELPVEYKKRLHIASSGSKAVMLEFTGGHQAV